MGLFIKNKTYNRSKKEEFFLNPLMKEPNGYKTAARCLEAIKAQTSPEQAFNFVSQYGFLDELLSEDIGQDERDEFFDAVRWFKVALEKLRLQQSKENVKHNLIECFKKQEPDQQLLAEARQLYPEQQNWIEFLLVVIGKSMDVNRNGIQTAGNIF